MYKSLLLIITFSAIFTITSYAQDKNDFTTYWDGGLKIESADNKFKLKIGGRLQYDMMVMSQSDTLQIAFPETYNGAELRRARYYFSGKLYSNISYKVQIDFAPNTITVKDAYLAFHKIPWVHNLKVGKFKVPFGLNTLTSSKHLTMMERPTTSDFDSERHLGAILYRNHFNKRFSWQAGFFYPNQDKNIYKGDEYMLSARIVGLPIYDTSGDNYTLLHAGISFIHTYVNGNSFEIKNHPESHLAPKYSYFKINSVQFNNMTNLELSYLYNRFSIQAEYHYVDFRTINRALEEEKILLSSYYGTFSFFLTDDHRTYSIKKTYFGNVIPHKNYGDNGFGALEVAIRYSHVDGNDDMYVHGGEMNNLALGINWYLNPAVKIAMNYIHSMNIAYDGYANIYQMRFQVAF